MKLFLSALLLSFLVSLSAFGAVDNIYTRANYPQPRLLDNNSRVFPITVAYTTDGNGTVLPVGPITADSFYYATPVATPISSGTTVVKAATAGTKKNFISGLQYSNLGGAAVVSLIDGSTVIWSAHVPASTGITSVSFDPPLKGTASTSTSFVVDSGSPTMQVSVQGFVR